MLGINDYIQITRRALAHIGEQVSNRLSWGYGYCQTKEDYELKEYATAVKLIRDGYKDCLCDDEIESIKSNIHRIVGPECDVVENDFSREIRPDVDKYLLHNPDCQAYEFMVDYLQAQCKKVGINFAIVEQKCHEVGIDLKITDKGVCDAIDIALDIQEKTCDITLDVDVTIENCLIDFQTQVVPLNCDLDFRTFVEEIACGTSLDVIIDNHNCGASIDVDVDDACEIDEESGTADQVIADFTVSADDTTVCYYTDIVLSIDNVQYPVEYSWNFGSGASPATAEGVGPHTIQYTTSGSKTVTVTATLGEQTSDETLGITVSTCLGNMIGTVEDTVGNPLVNYNFRLYSDANQDGVADSGTPVKSIFSNGAGSWSMASLTPGYYILEANFIDDDVTFEDLGDQDGIVDTLTAATPVVAGNKAVKVQIRPSQIQGIIQVIVDLT